MLFEALSGRNFHASEQVSYLLFVSREQSVDFGAFCVSVYAIIHTHNQTKTTTIAISSYMTLRQTQKKEEERKNPPNTNPMSDKRRESAQ